MDMEMKNYFCRLLATLGYGWRTIYQIDLPIGTEAISVRPLL